MKNVLCLALLGGSMMSMAYANTITIQNQSVKPMGVQYELLCGQTVCGHSQIDAIEPGSQDIILKAPQTGVRLTQLSAPFLPKQYQPWFPLPSEQCELKQNGTIRITADAHHIACSIKDPS